MFDPKSDPLGVGVQSRARENRFRLAAQGLSSPLGPLPDPQWDGFFQAVAESAPGRRIEFGQDEPEGGDDTYTDIDKYAEQTKALNQASPFQATLQGPSTQLGTLSLSALRHLRKGAR